MDTTKSKPAIAELGPSIRRSVHVCIESFPLVKECRWMRGRRWRADCGSSRERFRASQPQQFGVAIRSTQIANLTCLAVLAVFDQLSEFPNCFRPPPAHLAGLEIGRGQIFGEFDRYTEISVTHLPSQSKIVPPRGANVFLSYVLGRNIIERNWLTLRVVHVLLSCTSIVTPCRSRGYTGINLHLE